MNLSALCLFVINNNNRGASRRPLNGNAVLFLRERQRRLLVADDGALKRKRVLCQLHDRRVSRIHLYREFFFRLRLALHERSLQRNRYRIKRIRPRYFAVLGNYICIFGSPFNSYVVFKRRRQSERLALRQFFRQLQFFLSRIDKRLIIDGCTLLIHGNINSHLFGFIALCERCRQRYLVGSGSFLVRYRSRLRVDDALRLRLPSYIVLADLLRQVDCVVIRQKLSLYLVL